MVDVSIRNEKKKTIVAFEFIVLRYSHVCIREIIDINRIWIHIHEDIADIFLSHFVMKLLMR